MKKLNLIPSAFLLLSLSSFASSPEAWRDFRQELLDACIKKAEHLIVPLKIIEDQYGTEHFGVVVFEGMEPNTSSFGRVVCVKDKSSDRIELTDFIIDE